MYSGKQRFVKQGLISKVMTTARRKCGTVVVVVVVVVVVAAVVVVDTGTCDVFKAEYLREKLQ
jgi:hypothetical protein